MLIRANVDYKPRLIVFNGFGGILFVLFNVRTFCCRMWRKAGGQNGLKHTTCFLSMSAL